MDLASQRSRDALGQASPSAASAASSGDLRSGAAAPRVPSVASLGGEGEGGLSELGRHANGSTESAGSRVSLHSTTESDIADEEMPETNEFNEAAIQELTIGSACL